MMMNEKIHISMPVLFTFWRPLGLLVLAVTGTLGLIDLAAYGELMAPREPLGRALILITSIEAVWNVGRTVYDAWPGIDEIAAALFVTGGEMAIRYTGCVSVLVSTTAMAKGTAQTPLGPYVMLINLGVFVAIGVMEVALVVVHWRGVRGAKEWFTRILTIVESGGKDVDAAIGTEGR